LRRNTHEEEQRSKNDDSTVEEGRVKKYRTNMTFDPRVYSMILITLLSVTNA
jgi:hypothetical protein